MMVFPVDLALGQDILDLIAAAAAVVGICACLFGVRIWPAVCSLAALLVAFGAGAGFAYAHAPHRTGIMFGLGVAAGVVGAIIGAFAHRLFTVAIFAAAGWYVGSHVGAANGFADTDTLACGLGAAMLAAVAAVLFDAVAVVLLGAAAGAWSIVWGACFFFGHPFARQLDLWTLFEHAGQHRLPLLSVGVLMVAGLIVQTFIYLHAGPDPEEITEALDRADLPRKRRVAVLDDLRADGLITRGEYLHHLVRILSEG